MPPVGNNLVESADEMSLDPSSITFVTPSAAIPQQPAPIDAC